MVPFSIAIRVPFQMLDAVVLMLFSWLMVSCSESEGQKALNHVESVIEAHPDSALTLLRGVNKASLGSDKEKAQHALLMSMALDKNYIDTTTFDVIQPAIDYYLERDKGTPDDKLMTHSAISMFFSEIIFRYCKVNTLSPIINEPKR